MGNAQDRLVAIGLNTSEHRTLSWSYQSIQLQGDSMECEDTIRAEEHRKAFFDVNDSGKSIGKPLRHEREEHV